jgi:hypothetical protein
MAPTQYEGIEISFHFYYGDPHTIAIYQPIEAKDSKPNNELWADHFLQSCDGGFLNIARLAKIVTDQDLPIVSKRFRYFASLRAIKAADDLYSGLPDATVHLRTTSKPFHESIYSQRLETRRIKGDGALNGQLEILNDAFCCIAFFETGYINIDAKKFGGAMALSHGNSLFVANELLLDPAGELESSPVRRIIGTIGKPGLAVLVPPRNPEVREMDVDAWTIVDDKPFDGQYKDSFESTSLHLHFTGHELPLDVGTRGYLDNPAFFIETVIGVYNRGQWVADLDILKARSSYGSGWTNDVCKFHVDSAEDIVSTSPLTDEADVVAGNMIIKSRLTAIDSWNDLLDPPLGHSVVRAAGNPLARLAIATDLAQRVRRFQVVKTGNSPKYDPEPEKSRLDIASLAFETVTLSAPKPLPRELDPRTIADAELDYGQDSESDTSLTYPSEMDIKNNGDPLFHQEDLKEDDTDDSDGEVGMPRLEGVIFIC